MQAVDLGTSCICPACQCQYCPLPLGCLTAADLLSRLWLLASPICWPTTTPLPSPALLLHRVSSLTGGKTASLKTLGLQCLMAKAGLFLPQAPPEQQGQVEPQQGSPFQQQELLWFDCVLADLGDGQSLQQSLSTFSGHVRRLRNVLAAATPQVCVRLS